MRRNLPEIKSPYKPLFGPVVILLVLTILSLTLGRVLVSRLLTSRQDLAQARTKNEILVSKAQILEGTDEQQLRDYLQVATAAVSSQEPTLSALGRLRNLVSQNGLNINSLRVILRAGKIEGLEELNAIELATDIDGPLAQTRTFFDQMRRTAPLMKLTKLRISVKGGLAVSNFSAASAWAPLPEEIGKVDSPIDPLTSNEVQVLQSLAELEIPQEGQQVEPAPPQGRRNPFGL